MDKTRKVGKIDEVSFRPMKGGKKEAGIISHTRTKYDRGGQGGGPEADYESEERYHPTIAHAVKHLKSAFGHSEAE